MLALRPVTTTSQKQRLLTLSSSRPIFPPSSPTSLFLGFLPSVLLLRRLPYRPLASTQFSYCSTLVPHRIRTPLNRSNLFHTAWPLDPTKGNSLTNAQATLLSDAQSVYPVTPATMSSESDDDMPLARFNGRGEYILPSNVFFCPAPAYQCSLGP